MKENVIKFMNGEGMKVRNKQELIKSSKHFVVQ